MSFRLTQTLNAYRPTPLLGARTGLDAYGSSRPVLLNPSSDALFQVTTPVKLLSGATSTQVVVDASTATTDGPFLGTISFSERSNDNLTGVVEIDTAGAEIWFNSNEAIPAGSLVTIVNGDVNNDPTVQVATTGDWVLGTALTGTSAGNTPVRVLIQPSAAPLNEVSA